MVAIHLALLVNGPPGSAAAVRAEHLARRLPERYRVLLAYREHGRGRAAWTFLRTLAGWRPDLIYVVDMAASGVAAALAYRAARRVPVVIDTGDAIGALARAMGRGRIGTALTDALEAASIRHASALVVRGTAHRPMLLDRGAQAVTVIPDGVEPAPFERADGRGLRRRLGLDGATVVGVLGSSVWNEATQSCYGMELIDVLQLLRDRPIKALMVGGGTGIDRLKARAEALGLTDRIVFTGQVPYYDLPAHLAAMDIAISTQTNDAVGAVRTTGKLPLYLASGRFVLATRVGEAARILPETMLVDYDGVRDPYYPVRLAVRIDELLADPAALDVADEARALARRHFDYDRLAERLDGVLAGLLDEPVAPPPRRVLPGRRRVVS